MKHNDMRLDNAKKVFDLVFSGNSTISKIKEKTDLSRQAIKNICLKYAKKSIFDLETFKSSNRGRPEFSFMVSKKFFTAYAIQSFGRVDIIFINAFSNVVGRFDYCFDKKYSNEENFNNAINLITNHQDFLFCTDIFITCQEKFQKYVPCFAKIANQKEMIMNSYINDKEIIVFKFSSEIFVSFYGRISNIATNIDDIKKVVKIDKIYSFKKDDIIMEVINSLQHITIKNMIKTISN